MRGEGREESRDQGGLEGGKSKGEGGSMHKPMPKRRL